MSYLDRFSIQGMDGDKLTGVVLFGIIAIGFIVVASIAGAFLPSAPSSDSPSPDPKSTGAESTTLTAPAPTPQTQVAVVTPSPSPTPRPTNRWDDYGGSSSQSSNGGSSSSSTPKPSPTPVPLTREQLLLAVKINNTDSALNLTITNSLNNTINESLRNISGINVVASASVHSICGDDKALGCYWPSNKSIYIGELQAFNSTTICNTFENTLYHEEGHANYLSNHSYVNYSDKPYNERPDEIYSDGYASAYSKDRCHTENYTVLNSSKNTNNTLLQSAYEVYSSWLRIYPDPLTIPENVKPNYQNDSLNYQKALANFTIANNSYNRYMWDNILTTNPKPTDGTEVCTHVLTWAKNVVTGEIRQFPTSCLPNGWVHVIYITPVPTITSTPSINPNTSQLVNTIPIYNADIELTPYIKKALLNTDYNTLLNISSINIVDKITLSNICSDNISGCYTFQTDTNGYLTQDDKPIYINDLSGYSSIITPCNTFENTLYHEIGHANNYSYNKYIKYYGLPEYNPNEIYAKSYANKWSVDRCGMSVFWQIYVPYLTSPNQENLNKLNDYITQTVISTNDYIPPSVIPTSSPTPISTTSPIPTIFPTLTPIPTTTPIITPTPTPSPTPEPLLISFLWITDAHCSETNNCSGITKSLEEAKNNSINYMFDTGDLINSTSNPTILENSINLCKDNFPTCYYALGNHDEIAVGEQEWITITGMPSTNYLKNPQKKIRIITLNPYFNITSDGDWLFNAISNTMNKVIIFSHISLSGGNHSDVREFIENASNGNVMAVFSGHNHQNSHYTIGNIEYYTQKAMLDGVYSFVNITNSSISIDRHNINTNQNIYMSQSLEVDIPQLDEIPLLPIFIFNDTNVPIEILLPNVTPPLPLPEVQLPPTHTISSFGNIATSTAMNGLTDYGTLNELLSKLAISGNRLLIRDGSYNIDPIELPEYANIQCESNNVIIKTTTDSAHLITLHSNSIVKGCTLQHKVNGLNIFYINGNEIDWTIANNHFINSENSIFVINSDDAYPPKGGYGFIINNTGINSRLGSLKNVQNMTVSNNSFYDRSGAEFFDFNGNVHNSTFENNTLINSVGYTLLDEAVDLIGFNTHNIIRNNTMIGNFQNGLKPSYGASYNLIENNYIEYRDGVTPNEAGIILYPDDTAPSQLPSHNTITGNTILHVKKGIRMEGAENTVVTFNNINDVDIGIKLYNSPNSYVFGNTITNYRVKDIDGEYTNIAPPIIPQIPSITPLPIIPDSCYIVPNGIPSYMEKYVGVRTCTDCHNSIPSSWQPCDNSIPITPPAPITPTTTPNPNPVPADSATIAIFGDAHMAESKDRVPQLTSDFNNYASLSPTGKVDAIFTTGDMETVTKVDEAHQASTLKNIPLYYTIGNHDVGDIAKVKSLEPTTIFKVNPGPTGNEKLSFSVEVGNIHVVILDAYWDGKTNEGWLGGGNGGGEIGTTLTNWLQNDLQSATTKYKIVLDHEPMYPYKRHMGDSLDFNTKSRDALQVMLESQGVDAFFSGHTHYSASVMHGNILQVNDGVPGTKSGNNAESFRSVWFVNTASNGDLILTWTHSTGTGSSWSNPIVKTFTINQPTTPSLDVETPIPQLGVFNREKVPMVDDEKLKWQIIATPEALLSYKNLNSIVAFNYWSPWSNTKSKWTDIAPDGFIQSRFNDAYKYQNYYEYAPFLLHEEMYSPISLTTWAEPISSWQLEGKATFNGREVKLLKTWIEEDKGMTWNPLILNDLENPLLVEWDKYYSTQLYIAWNEYIHSLGKKSMVIGFMPPKPIYSQYDEDLNYQTSANKYILANYDAIVDYSYPTNLDDVSISENKAKYLREKYNGTLLWLLTTSFEDMPWDWQEAIAQAEFNAIFPYVDAIISYPYTDMGNRKRPYPIYVLSFISAL